MKRVESKISVKEGNEETINISGNDIYAKLDGVTANDLYSSLSQTNKKISSSIEFKIFNYLDQIREIIRASEIQ
jgi:hypothetical protein